MFFKVKNLIISKVQFEITDKFTLLKTNDVSCVTGRVIDWLVLEVRRTAGEWNGIPDPP